MWVPEPKLSFACFRGWKDNLDSYLLRFERYATVAGWEQASWATRLSPLLSGRALDVYSGMSDEDALDYKKLQRALLQRYDFTEQGYRERFRGAKPEGQESPSQFIVRISNYFCKWVELAGVEKTFEGVSELVVREQFTNSCPKDVSVFLKERSPKNLEELAQLVEQYLNAHNKKLATKAPVVKQDVKDNRPSLPWSQRDATRCYACDGRGHKAVECPNRMSASRNEPLGRVRRTYCFKCGAMGHEARDCRMSPQRTQTGSKPGGRATGGASTQAQRVACAMQVSRKMEEKESESGVETLELKSGEKIRVLNGACMGAEVKDNLPVLSGKVGDKVEEIFQDSGCSGVIVKRELVDEADFTGEMGHIMTVDRVLKRAPIARVKVDTPFFVGTVEALCLKDPLFDLIIGNVPGARGPGDPNPEWGVVAAVVTRAQARESKEPKPLKVKDVTKEMAVDKEELIKLQEEDTTLERFKKLKGAEIRKGYVISFEKHGGIWYRMRQRKGDPGETRKQILVPKSLRERVMGVAHDSLFGGHLGVKKTEDRIQTNFFWQGTRRCHWFCRSCDVCQKTVAKGCTTSTVGRYATD